MVTSVDWIIPYWCFLFCFWNSYFFSFMLSSAIIHSTAKWFNHCVVIYWESKISICPNLLPLKVMYLHIYNIGLCTCSTAQQMAQQVQCFGCAKNRMGDASVIGRREKMAWRQNCGEWAAKWEIPMWLLGREERKNKKCRPCKSRK